jgi:hypothetical protein
VVVEVVLTSHECTRTGQTANHLTTDRYPVTFVGNTGQFPSPVVRGTYSE